MVLRTIELAKTYSALTANSSARKMVEKEKNRQGSVASLKEMVMKLVHPSLASKRLRKSTVQTSRLEIEMAKGEHERLQMATITREMKRVEKVESEGDKTKRQREQVETKKRFKREMEKLIMVGKMRLAGDAGWMNAIGEYSDDDESIEGEGGGKGWKLRKRQAVRQVWYWLT